MIAAALDRSALRQWYRRNRRRSSAIFGLIDDGAHYDRPIPLRHPFIFYEGHLPAFSFNTLCGRALHEPPVDEALQRLFERGIDPGSEQDAHRHDRANWPSRDEVAAFARACDERVEAALLQGDILYAYTILEHEPTHHETLTYILHQLGRDKKQFLHFDHRDWAQPANPLREIAAGTATLGADPRETPFGWDNEFPKTIVDVGRFAIATYPVTNGDWLRFLNDGGPKPQFWLERDGQWFLRAQFEELPLPHSWPAYVTHRQAQAYAQWAGMRLPTESEYHRAAFGNRDGTEAAFPWGSDTPSTTHGNFDFQRFDPEPVDAHPAGTSAWGVADLVGNGWEWTATPFGPFDGFSPMPSYPQYSADFFDGKHYVMKGASPVTPRELIRRSFRNWFYDDYPYMYAKFRCAAS